MPSPGAAMHHLAAIPHRLLKLLIRPWRSTETTVTVCGRSSERRTIAPASTLGDDASSSPPTQLLPTLAVAELHKALLAFPAAMTSSARFLAGVDACAAAGRVLVQAPRSSASVYFSMSPGYPKLMFTTSGPPRLARARVNRFALPVSLDPSCDGVIGVCGPPPVPRVIPRTCILTPQAIPWKSNAAPTLTPPPSRWALMRLATDVPWLSLSPSQSPSPETISSVVRPVWNSQCPR